MKKVIFFSLFVIGQLVIPVKADDFDNAYAKIVNDDDKNKLAQMLYSNIYVADIGQAGREAGDAENEAKWQAQLATQSKNSAELSNQKKIEKAAKKIKDSTWAQSEVIWRKSLWKISEKDGIVKEAWKAAWDKSAEEGRSKMKVGEEPADQEKAERQVFFDYYQKVYNNLKNKSVSAAQKIGRYIPDVLPDPKLLVDCALFRNEYVTTRSCNL